MEYDEGYKALSEEERKKIDEALELIAFVVRGDDLYNICKEKINEFLCGEAVVTYITARYVEVKALSSIGLMAVLALAGHRYQRWGDVVRIYASSLPKNERQEQFLSFVRKVCYLLDDEKVAEEKVKDLLYDVFRVWNVMIRYEYTVIYGRKIEWFEKFASKRLSKMLGRKYEVEMS